MPALHSWRRRASSQGAAAAGGTRAATSPDAALAGAFPLLAPGEMAQAGGESLCVCDDRAEPGQGYSDKRSRSRTVREQLGRRPTVRRSALRCGMFTRRSLADRQRVWLSETKPLNDQYGVQARTLADTGTRDHDLRYSSVTYWGGPVVGDVLLPEVQHCRCHERCAERCARQFRRGRPLRNANTVQR